MALTLFLKARNRARISLVKGSDDTPEYKSVAVGRYW
jgi:hypothetical protein